jgi:hypothetical protein
MRNKPEANQHPTAKKHKAKGKSATRQFCNKTEARQNIRPQE